MEVLCVPSRLHPGYVLTAAQQTSRITYLMLFLVCTASPTLMLATISPFCALATQRRLLRPNRCLGITFSLYSDRSSHLALSHILYFARTIYMCTFRTTGLVVNRCLADYERSSKILNALKTKRRQAHYIHSRWLNLIPVRNANHFK